MKIILLTQDDPFYLAENISYLLDRMPSHSEVIGCVLFDVAPFGKKKSIIEQAKDTYKTFGMNFFLHYSFRYVLGKFDKLKSITYILEKYKIPLIRLSHPINHESSIALIKNYQPDLLISIGGNQIFKKAIIELAPKGCLNLHTALLPKYRGLMPSFWVLKNGEAETGVSVFYVDEGIDSGPILVQKKVAINNMTQQELIHQTKKIGMDSILEAIEKIYHGNTETLPNPDSEMTYFSRPTTKDVKEFLRNGKKFF